jgi:copper transport protein
VTAPAPKGPGGVVPPVWLLPLLAALWLLATPRTALAHAEVVGVDPPPGVALSQAPAGVRLLLTEPVERGVFVLRVYGPDGERADRRDARVEGDPGRTLAVGLRDAGSGRYTVVWRVLSTDGHVSAGSSVFAVGAGSDVAGRPSTAVGEAGPGGGSSLLDPALRWLTYLTAFALVGGLAAGPLVLWPSIRLAGAKAPALATAVWGRHRRLAGLAGAGLLLLGLLSLVSQAAEVTGLSWPDALQDGVAARMATQTRYGELWLVRMGLLLAVLAALAAPALPQVAGWQGRARRPAGRIGGRIGDWIGLEIGAVYLLALAAGGHAGAGGTVAPLAVGLDWLHLLAGALWVGGLLQLTLVLAPMLAPAAPAALDPAARDRVLRHAGRRFTRVALPSVAVLVGTGVFAARRFVPDWESLAATPYGAALVTKLLLAGPLLLLGAAAFWLVRSGRRTRRAAAPGAGLLRRLVGAEAILAVAVLAATGVLTGLPPATNAPGPGRPFAALRWVGDVRVLLTVVPNVAGVTNRVTVTLQDREGKPVPTAGVGVTLRQADTGAAIEEVSADRLMTGHLPVSALLPVAGPWEAEVRLPGPAAGGGTAVARFAFEVGLAPDSEGTDVRFSPLRILRSTPAVGPGAGVVLLTLAGVVGVVRARRASARRWLPAAAGPAALALGVFLTGNALATGYRQSVLPVAPLPPVSPVPATGASLARGEVIYRQSCLACHGLTGRGDGPAAGTLRSRPADLRVHMVAGHTDPELYAWVSDGIAGTEMPGFSGRLDAEDRWHVVNYIRQLGDVSAVAGAPPPGGGAP